MTHRIFGASVLVVLALFAAGGTPPAIARPGSIEAVVTDQTGKPVLDAVVSLMPLGGPPALRPTPAVMDQVNKEFVPSVLPVVVGTAVSFPNRDNIRHHVYSFSSAKKFELPLYAGLPAEPVTFDKEGFVTLGCNIHDWMIAYVAVLPTPYFRVTADDGRATLNGLPPGQYSIAVWHPLLRGPLEGSTQHVDLTRGDGKPLVFTLDLKPDFRAKRAPGLTNGGYP